MASLVNGFVFQKVDPADTRMMEMIYRLRFDVYARQCKFIREDDYPSQSESDEYDEHSVHFAAINPRGMLVATARMIMAKNKSSPLLKSFPYLPNQHNVSKESIVEISRFMISKNLLSSNNFYAGHSSTDRLMKILRYAESNRLAQYSSPLKNCHINQGMIVGGLCREIYLETRRRGIEYWCALMERGLCLLLKRYGIKLTCVGDDVDLFGPVRPYLARISDFEESKFLKFKSVHHLPEAGLSQTTFLNN